MYIHTLLPPLISYPSSSPRCVYPYPSFSLIFHPSSSPKCISMLFSLPSFLTPTLSPDVFPYPSLPLYFSPQLFPQIHIHTLTSLLTFPLFLSPRCERLLYRLEILDGRQRERAGLGPLVLGTPVPIMVQPEQAHEVRIPLF